MRLPYGLLRHPVQIAVKFPGGSVVAGKVDSHDCAVQVEKAMIALTEIVCKSGGSYTVANQFGAFWDIALIAEPNLNSSRVSAEAAF